MWRYLAIIVVALGLGYGSNAMSQAACLENAAFWYTHVMMSSQPYYVKLDPGQEHIPEVLDQVGAPYTVLTPTSEKTAFPHVRIRTNAWIPFVVSEQFEAAEDATGESVSRRIISPCLGFPYQWVIRSISQPYLCNRQT